MPTNPLNATECEALLHQVNWFDPWALVKLTLLALLSVVVIVGNCLVIAAVFCSSKLRSVTNLFIVSLAVADLSVGVAVLPFSATWEVFKVWIFGDLWCDMWLALDVWMCTASILNLCAISLDRYVAVTRPITYPSIMSHSRAKMLIAGLWVLSFVICFPPLVGWKDNKVCPWKCELTNDAGYVVYSALGSFYIPMFVMLFFYWRIYKAAVRTTRAINQGFRTTKGGLTLGNRFEEQRLTLRIHRGRGSSGRFHHFPTSPQSNGSSNTTTTDPTSPIPPAKCKHERVKISVSYPSSDNISGDNKSPHLLMVAPTSPTYSVHYSPINGRDTAQLYNKRENHLRVHRLTSRRRASSSSRRSSSCDGTERATSPSLSSCEDGLKQPNKIISKRMGKRNIKAQVKRFRMETKAAKTLAIIVGGFIFCWLPFFTMYLIRAFCPTCINPLVFSILFWLGYFNSAINPLIYALFSKDFRFAFKRIICRCFCRDTHGVSLSRRGSDGSQLQGRQFRSASYNTQQQEPANSLEGDGDPGGEASDSR